jgi:TonB family protein
MISSRLTAFIVLSIIVHAAIFAAVVSLIPVESEEQALPLMVGVTTRYNDPGTGKGNSLQPSLIKEPEAQRKAERIAEKKTADRVVKKTPPKITRENEIVSKENKSLNEQTAVTSTVLPGDSGETAGTSPEGQAGGGGGGIGDRGTGLDTKGTGRGSETGYPNYELNPKPEYPQIAKRRGYEGLVILNVFVLESGNVGKVEIRKSSGYDVLDNSALDAVKKWVFIPGKRNGHPTSSWVVVPIRFDLTKG